MVTLVTSTRQFVRWGSVNLNCCKKTCVNLDTDNLNCGKCGKQCKSGKQCCKENCVNIQTNRSNCGTCGYTCLNTDHYCSGNNLNCGNGKIVKDDFVKLHLNYQYIYIYMRIKIDTHCVTSCNVMLIMLHVSSNGVPNHVMLRIFMVDVIPFLVNIILPFYDINFFYSICDFCYAFVLVNIVLLNCENQRPGIMTHPLVMRKK
ncbi:hypothetical protein RHMOL_Rhmol13G0206900 [Rhododendron molle]|uniref:Uncharacterized protein n=1 Tax=Rhododendron molle TaxID=49168 RepID=A0ACC0L957_RHOML|nr:hypothetical protein RHMOL_Rhmol13G0206900 [Rhododendron molle]